MNDHTDLKKMAIAAKIATFEMAKASLKQKNEALEILVKSLKIHEKSILRANREDISLAKKSGINAALLERLSLENRIEGIIHDIAQIIDLPDPVGVSFNEKNLPNQLKLRKYRTPLGVIGVIYESRPNVTLDISALTIKSSNCAILRGGSESLNTNKILVELIQQSLKKAGLPTTAIQIVANSDRASVKELLQLHEYVDLIIPRGSSTLQKFCRTHTTIPIIMGGIGICHLFVDETADLESSLKVILNAKTQRPTVCNALDTVLIHTAVAPTFIPKIIRSLSNKGVTFRLDDRAWNLQKDPSCKLAESNDWDTEWLSLILGIKVVENIEEAIQHIHTHSTHHSDGILTENQLNAEKFMKEIDSAAVYVNASTRFTDGSQLGIGAEVAISTQKLHARGPMGLNELTSYKWIIQGNYQVRK